MNLSSYKFKYIYLNIILQMWEKCLNFSNFTFFTCVKIQYNKKANNKYERIKN